MEVAGIPTTKPLFQYENRREIAPFQQIIGAEPAKLLFLGRFLQQKCHIA